MIRVIAVAAIIRRLFNTDHTTETGIIEITIAVTEMIAVTGKIVGIGETAVIGKFVEMHLEVFPQRGEMARIRMERFIRVPS